MTTTYYVLDPDDRITEVGGVWNEFAIQNNAPGALRHKVLGKSLWKFIAGDETIAAISAILSKTRETETRFEFPVRCDGPAFQQWDMMQAEALGRGRVVVTHRTQIRQNWRNAEPRRPNINLKVKCSFCCRISNCDRWFYEKAKRLLWHQTSSFHVCPDCTDAIGRQLDYPQCADPQEQDRFYRCYA